MGAIETRASVRLSCLIDTDGAQEKGRVIIESLHDILRDSSFHLEDIEVNERDHSPSSVLVVGFITLVSHGYSELAKKEFEQIKKYARKKTHWKLERAPCLELHTPPLPKAI